MPDDPVLGIALDRLVGVLPSPVLGVSRLGGGRSNITALVDLECGDAVVVKRPPLGMVLETAHDVVREARFIAAVGRAGMPVPRILAVLDEAVPPLVVMEHVDGIAIRDSASAASAGAAARAAAGGALVDALAGLHALDPGAIGLGDLVRPSTYVGRQLRRWWQQWEATGGTDPRMARLYAALGRALPDEQAVTVVHGDPKLDNCVFDADGALRALVDWELATMGDPLADLALLLAYWSEPADAQMALQDPPTRVPGFATRAELVAHYALGTSLDLSALPFYAAFSYWKLACIVQGIHRRMAATGGSDDPRQVADQVVRLVDLADAALERGCL